SVSAAVPAASPAKRSYFWPVVAGGLAVAVLLLLALLLPFTAAPAEAIDSIAVLPFENVSGDPELEYLSDGIADSITNSLSQIANLRVMSSTSVRRYKGTSPDPQLVGKELNVKAVVVGRVLQASDDLSINIELIDTQNNAQLWGGRYERRLADVLGMKQEIAQEISGNLHLELSGEQQEQIAKQGTDNPEAYQDYLQGLYHWNTRTPEGFERALGYFQSAIDKDPTYAQAYSGLSDTYFLQAVYGGRSINEFLDLERSAAQRALELDETLAEAHASMGSIKSMHEWDWEAGDDHFKRAIELNPSYFRVYQTYANLLKAQGRFAEYREVYNKALALDPLSAQLLVQHSGFLISQGDHEEAVRLAEKAFELAPDSPATPGALFNAYWYAGMHNKALAHSEKNFPPDYTKFYGQLAEGNLVEARATLESWEGLPHFVKGFRYAMLGEKDLAIEWLTKAVDERYNYVIFYKTNFQFELIRDDPRFQELLRRINLEP
ncbi:MAG: tetratricopeptide repeat protein, partial [Nitrososphaerales archaeon]